jgi:hypothetical protein
MPQLKVLADSHHLGQVREFFNNLKSQFASAATVYEGPIKTLFEEVRGKLENALNALPKESEGDWDMQCTLDNVVGCMASTSSLLTQLGLELSKHKQMASAAKALEAGASAAVLGEGHKDTLAAALTAGTHLSKGDHEAAVSKAVDAAIAARTGAQGDLVAKTTVDQLCSAAKDLGIKEGRAAEKADAEARLAAEKLATERTAALTQAGLPLPEAEPNPGLAPNLGLASAAILRAPEAEFAAARGTVETRIKGFTEAGLELPAELLAACWAPEAEFKKFQKTVTSIPALKVRAGRVAEPFATPPAGGTASATVPMLG